MFLLINAVLIASAMFATDAPKSDSRDEQIKILNSVVAQDQADLKALAATIQRLQAVTAYYEAKDKESEAIKLGEIAHKAHDAQIAESCKVAPSIDSCQTK